MSVPTALQTPAPPLVGRARELATLRAALDATLAGRGTLVLIGGEAGIGKTTLAETLLRESATRGAAVLVGRCYDLGETPPYGPWTETCARLPGGAALPPPLGAGETAESQAAHFARVRGALADAANRAPLVVLLEDLHWADAASLDLLRVVGRDLGALPLLLLATYRDDELAGGRPLAASLPALVRETHAARLTLSRLDAADTGSLVRSRYRLSPGDEARLSGHLHAHAEGNPLYLGELLRSLEEEGLLRPDAAGPGWALGDLAATRVPLFLRQIIGARVARLGEDAGLLLTLAAVIGQAVPLDLWAAVGEASDDVLAAVVGPAVAARVLTETPDGQGVRFAHALVRSALYEAIPLPRRRALHRRVADAYLATPTPDPDGVAYHLQHAGDARAADWLVRAGEYARRAYAWLDAAERYEAALQLLNQRGTDPPRRGWLLSQLAGICRYRDTRRTLTYLDEAIAMGVASEDKSLIANSRFNHGLFTCFLGEFHRGLAEMEAGLEAIEAWSQAEAARSATMMDYTPGMQRGSLALWLAIAGHFDHAHRMAEEVFARPLDAQSIRSVGDSALGDTLFALLCTHAALGRPEEARQAYALTRAAYEAVNHHALVGLVTLWALSGVALRYAPDDLAARRRLAEAAETAWRHASGSVVETIPPGFARLPLLVLEGHWAEARALESQRIAVWFVDWSAVPVLAALAREQGDTALAWRLIREWLPGGPQTTPGEKASFVGVPLTEVAAGLALDAGDLTTARLWLELHDRWLAWSGAVPGQAEGQLGWATYHRTAGAVAPARECAARALALAAEPRQPLALLATHRAIGALDTADSRHTDAQLHLDAALALAEACAAPYERALTLLALAELRLAEGRHETTRATLDEAHTILTNLGARPALARCERLATRVHHPVGTPYPARLTAREVEVLRLIAAGRSNREMAETLCRSERTVERHIENIYRKIGAHSKADATAFAFRHHLA